VAAPEPYRTAARPSRSEGAGRRPAARGYAPADRARVESPLMGAKGGRWMDGSEPRNWASPKANT